MATYIVGDLHGCFDELQRLLNTVNFDPLVDELWLTGDLVARGEKSLECLRFVKSLGDQATVVLGNHDVHLLSTALGIKAIKDRDNVSAIFDADDKQELLDWLRYRPLLAQHPKFGFVLTHAGISPQWDLTTAKAVAKEVEALLQSDNYGNFLTQIYDNQPDLWQEDLVGMARWRYILNAFTRMRFCYADKRLDFSCKLPVTEAPDELKPWFELDNPLYQQQDILFGHWASLNGYNTPECIYPLDTGCVWGNYLSLLRWDDKTYFTQAKLNKLE